MIKKLRLGIHLGIHLGIPYVVLPGNAGRTEDLRKAVGGLEKNEKPVVAVLIGDGSGVGPELTAKLAAKGILNEHARPVVMGDVHLWKYALEAFDLNVNWKLFDSMDTVDWEHGIPVIHVGDQDPGMIEKGKVNQICGKACLDMICYAVSLFKNGKIQGVCYAPLNKGAMKLADSPAASETELFSMLLGQEGECGEINMLDQVWTTRVTSHIPVSAISSQLTVDGIVQAICLADKTLKKAGYRHPKIGVCALNPHAGEGGLCGDEEGRVISPAIREASGRGIDAQGPFASDILFKQAFDGTYNAVVTMYHDQGQIALKLKGFERGITIVGGLNMPATTCAHGTAHDIAWKGIASTQSLENAFCMVCRMAGESI